jgi:large subunit ribosomal protein L4
MYKARYYKADGKKGRARALPDTLFDGVVHEAVMHQVVKAYLSNQRQGTGAAKSRGQVRGGSRKPWRQKGTGRARQGTIRAAQWEGGGVAFPPIPHSWRQRVPKKVRSLARRSALNDRAENDRVVLVDLPSMEGPRTRDLIAFLGGLEAGGKVLVLTNGKNDNVYLSSRNVKDVSVLPFGNESVYDVLWAHTVVIERSALEAAEATADEEPEAAEAAADEEAVVATAAAEASTAAAAEAKTADADGSEAASDDEAGHADEEESPDA